MYKFDRHAEAHHHAAGISITCDGPRIWWGVRPETDYRDAFHLKFKLATSAYTIFCKIMMMMIKSLILLQVQEVYVLFIYIQMYISIHFQ